MAELARLVIHRGNDPFTLPRSTTVYVKDDFGIPWPVLKWSYMWSELAVVINGPDTDAVKNAVMTALQQAVIKSLAVGLATAYMTGGMAGLNAAANTFINDLDNAIEAAIGAAVDTSYNITNNYQWGDYQ